MIHDVPKPVSRAISNLSAAAEVDAESMRREVGEVQEEARGSGVVRLRVWLIFNVRRVSPLLTLTSDQDESA